MKIMDISTGRCPTKKVDCSCVKVCQKSYGQKVRELRQATLNVEGDEFIRNVRALNNFVDKYQHKL